IIVTVTSTLFAFGVLRIKAQLEQVIFDQMAREQLQLLLARVDAGSYDRNSLFKDWSFHFGKDTESLHPNLLALAPGSYHSVRIDERYYQVEVGLHHGSKVFLTYDITDWENQEHALLGLLAW